MGVACLQAGSASFGGGAGTAPCALALALCWQHGHQLSRQRSAARDTFRIFKQSVPADKKFSREVAPLGASTAGAAGGAGTTNNPASQLQPRRVELLTLKFFQPMMMLRKAPTVAAALTSSMMALQEDGRERGEGGILVGIEKPLPAFAGQEVVGEQSNLLAPVSGCACWTVTVM